MAIERKPEDIRVSVEGGDGGFCSCNGLCQGRSGLFWTILLWPLVLLYNSLNTYLFPCIGIMGRRFGRCICYPFIRCCGTWEFLDKDFEGDAALGDPELCKDVEWLRAHELFPNRKGPVQLFEDKIEPADLCQGGIGDCWLVAALASASEHPESIRRCFVTREYNPRGKYIVNIWDGQAGKWVQVTVDDRIPCRKGRSPPYPIFMRPNGSELWAIIMEKAYAKFCGSYKKLGGGISAWAWAAVTGDYVFQLCRAKDGRWVRDDMVPMADKANRRKVGWRRTEEKYSDDQVWVLIQRYIKAKALLTTSIPKSEGGKGGGLNGENVRDAHGLVEGHSYSILDAVELGMLDNVRLIRLRNPWGTFEWKGPWSDGSQEWKKNPVVRSACPPPPPPIRLIRLRNPWGTFEWKGPWSDGSQEWKKNPVVRMRLKPKDDDDGSFWMPFQDFFTMFGDVDICDRTSDRDLRLSPLENHGACGVCLGCISGCATYWLCCRGARVIYGGHISTGETKSAERGCCGRV